MDSNQFRWSRTAIVVAVSIALGVGIGANSTRWPYHVLLAEMIAFVTGVVGGALSLFRSKRRVGLRLVLISTLFLSAVVMAMQIAERP